jgi:hypothetical protein
LALAVNNSKKKMQAAVEGDDDDDIFIYTGGAQVVPRDVRRVRIDKSVKIIPAEAFLDRRSLIYVEFHDGIERIEARAFARTSLRRVKLLGVKVIEMMAFASCISLTEVEFGDNLETIGQKAFAHCSSLRSVKMLSVRTIGWQAFENCYKLKDLVLPEGLETVGVYGCPNLRRITMPLKDNMISADVFFDCRNLTTVALSGGIHKTIASLHMESWKNEMREEIDRINQVLPNTHVWGKTAEIRQWIRSVIGRIEHYRTEHKALLKEATSLLELALWKAHLDGIEGGILEQERVRTTRGQRKRARKEICVTSGASIVIKNVLPFLTLLE